MPAFLEPNLRFKIILDIDQRKPEEACPYFIVKSMSVRDAKALTTLIDSLPQECKTSDELYARTIEAILDNVFGWQNMNGLEFNKENLEHLSYKEMKELLSKLYSNQHVQLEEKKS